MSRIGLSLMVLGAVAFGHAQYVAQLPRAKGAARVKVKLENPWRPSPNAERARRGDFNCPKGSMTIVGFIKGSPKKYQEVPNYIYDRIKKKQVPVRKGKSGKDWRYYAYWIKTDAITTVSLIGRSGARTINLTATFTRPVTQKEIDAVIRMGASARV